MQVDRQLQSEFKENIVEVPTLDNKAYESYTGLTRLNRLIYIADHHPNLRMKALKIGIEYAISSQDVTMYELLHRKVANGNRALSDNVIQSNVSDMPLYDSMWVEAGTKDAAEKLKQLELELENCNSTKEGMRCIRNDLGDHYLTCGDKPNALRCYLQGLDYCTSGSDVVNMCLKVIKVSMFLEAWSNVSIYVSKALATLDCTEGNAEIVSKLKCAAGLACLARKDYRAAAEHFVEVSFEYCPFSDLISSNHVAVYGGLCALATFDRKEMQKLIISNSTFKSFLELEPKLQDAIQKYYELHYEAGAQYLNENRGDLSHDMSIAPHLDLLYTMIRDRAGHFENAEGETAKLSLFLIGDNYLNWYGSIEVSPLDTVRKMEQLIERRTFISPEFQTVAHRGANLHNGDIVEVIGIKAFDAIVVGKTQEEAMPSTSAKSDRKRRSDEEERWLKHFFQQRFHIK